MANGRGRLEAIGGAFRIAFALATPFLRPWRTRWGATSEEVTRNWAGDPLVRRPDWQSTMAITVNAPPERIWPFLVQVGQGRGGFYSYERLENLIGCGVVNAERVLPEHQSLAVGDLIRLHRQGPPLTVAVLETRRALVMHGGPADGLATTGTANAPDVESTWALLLEPGTDGTTRLVSRTRYRHGRTWIERLAGGPTLLEPISYVMTRKMLRVLKHLIEQPSGSP